MADTKNFGLKGVGNDIQLGKAGSRLNLSGSAIQARNATDSAYVNFKVLTPVADEDAATKLYVDNVASGLDPKESCQCATTANLSNFTTGGNNGQFTGVPASIDGVTLAEGDRVLVKNQSTATQNGIYVVTATTTTIQRAPDHDGTPAGNVSGGNFTFVESGTTYANTGWVVSGDGVLTVNTDNIDWVQFSGAGTYIAGTGLTLTGSTFDLDFSELTGATTIALADELIFQDSGVESRITVQNFLNDRDIPHSISANGLVTRTAADTYTSRSVVASAVAGDEGISVVNGDGVSGNITIGVDILGQTNLTTDDVDDADELLIYHSVAGGTEGVGNYAITASKLKSYMNAGTSTTTITEGDSSVAVSDAGSGTITTTVDSTAVITSVAASTSFNHDVIITTGDTLTLTDLTENDVMIVGASGVVEDSGGLLTFNGTTLALTGVQTITTDSATTNADIPTLTLRATSSGTPAAGIGPSIVFEAETSAGAPGNVEIGGLLALEATDVTSTSEDFDFVFQLMSAGATAAEVARITSTGSVFLDEKAAADADTAGQGQIWVNSGGTTNDLYFTDDTGQDVQLTNNGAIAAITGTVANNQVVTGTGTSAVDSSANLTFDGTTLTVTGVLIVDEITIDGDTISNNTTDQPLILRPNGTGSIIFQNGSSEEILELNDTVSAVNGLAITAGATGVAPTITTGTGAEANIDIGFLTNGTGVLSVTAGSGNYEDNVTADDDIPNKAYVDNAVAAGVGLSGNIDSVTGTVDLTSAGTQNIGAATGIPANATIMSVTLDVTVASPSATTVTVGDATNGAASYMAASENDPQVTGIYIADGRLDTGASDKQATATVATPGASGSATCIITFRHP